MGSRVITLEIPRLSRWERLRHWPWETYWHLVGWPLLRRRMGWPKVVPGRPPKPCDCVCHSLASGLGMSHREDCCPHPGVRRRFLEVTDA